MCFGWVAGVFGFGAKWISLSFELTEKVVIDCDGERIHEEKQIRRDSFQLEKHFQNICL